MLTVERFVRGPLDNNVYLLVHAATGCCAVVDPGIGSEDVLDAAQQRGLRVTLILNTHAHFDHVFLNGWFAAATGAPVALHAADLPLLRQLAATCAAWGLPTPPQPSPEPQVLLKHGMQLDVCGCSVEVRHTPGHSPGQVALLFPGHCISGDTLFAGGVGRWDLPGASFEQLEQSIRGQLYSLPDDTMVWPGHGEPTTIGAEREGNPFVRGAGGGFSGE